MGLDGLNISTYTFSYSFNVSIEALLTKSTFYSTLLWYFFIKQH